MELVTSCLLLASGADVSALGSPDWQSREAAESRLRAWGAAAWPFLWSAERSDDPETRERAGRLLVPYHSMRADMRAWAVIRDPWPVDPVAFYDNRALRERIKRLATAAGFGGNYRTEETAGVIRVCGGDWWVDELVPDDAYSVWNWDVGKQAKAVLALDAARRQFGNDGPGWILSP